MPERELKCKQFKGLRNRPFKKRLVDLFLCVYVFCLCVCLCVSGAQRPEDSVGSLGMGVTDGL